MSTKTTPSEYMVISRGNWDKSLSPEYIRKAINQFWTWFERLSNERKIKGGHRLADEGKILAGRNSITDGPFGESKEVVGGYWFMLADSLEEAARLAQGNPCLDYGITVEVRPVVVDPWDVRMRNDQHLRRISNQLIRPRVLCRSREFRR